MSICIDAEGISADRHDMNKSMFKSVLREAMVLMLAACFALGVALASLPMHAHGSSDPGSQLAAGDTLCLSLGSTHTDTEVAKGEAGSGLAHAGECLHCLCANGGSVPPAGPAHLCPVCFGKLGAVLVVSIDVAPQISQGPPPARGPPLTV